MLKKSVEFSETPNINTAYEYENKYYCAKRSFRPWVPENLLSVLLLLLLRKIIDFCEGDMEGASLLLSTGSLNI